MRIQDHGNTVIITFDPDEAEGPLPAQLRVFLLALAIYDERNEHYKDNWKPMGQRGMLIRIRERSERLWYKLWPAPPETDYTAFKAPAVDDAVDLINFAGFLVRALNGEATHGGTWWS